MSNIKNKAYKILSVIMLLIWGFITYSSIFNVYQIRGFYGKPVLPLLIVLGIIVLLLMLVMIYKKIENYIDVKYNTSTKAFENIAKQTPSVSFGAECIVKGTLVSKGSLVGNIYKYSTGKINTLKTTLDVMNVTEIDMVLIVIKYYYVTVELNIINK